MKEETGSKQLYNFMAASAHQWYHGVRKRKVHVLQLFHVAQEGSLRMIAGEERERYSVCVCVWEGGGGPHELKVGCVRKLLVLWNSEPKMEPSIISSGDMSTIESWCAFVEGEGREREGRGEGEGRERGGRGEGEGREGETAYNTHTHKQL